MKNFQLVTCNASSPKESYYCEAAFHASLARYNVTPIILGQPPYKWHWGGLGSKAKWLKRAIDEKIITADVVIFTDCHDLVYAAHPQAVVDLFLAQRCPIVWGAEKNCFVGHNGINLSSLHPDTEYSYKYLNSGWGMGYTSALKESLDEMRLDLLRDDYQLPNKLWVENNDQNAWMRQMLFGNVRIGIDSKCELILNYQNVRLEDIALETGGRIRVVETGAYPMVQHFNGSSKDYGLMKPVLKHLGLQ